MRATSAIVLLCVFLCAEAPVGVAHAATRDKQSKACRSDAFRLCAAEIPSRARIEACMKAHYDELSAPCKEMFDPPSDIPSDIPSDSEPQQRGDSKGH